MPGHVAYANPEIKQIDPQRPRTLENGNLSIRPNFIHMNADIMPENPSATFLLISFSQ